MRDQLDRFGEIDHTARLLGKVAADTSRTVVINREDHRLASLPERIGSENIPELRWYGLAPHLRSSFPSDDELWDSQAEPLAAWGKDNAPGANIDARQEGGIVDGPPDLTDRDLPAAEDTRQAHADVELSVLDGSRAGYTICGELRFVNISLKGVYNAFNAAGALALIKAIADGEGLTELLGPDDLLDALASVKSAFGRGEEMDVEGVKIELVLVKNPGGFRLALQSLITQGYEVMIAINDEYADGRDMSWLYDVSFASLAQGGVAIVSGTRAWDMALRLRYDEVSAAAVDCDLASSLRAFLSIEPQRPHRIYCTYTAMLTLRKQLLRLAGDGGAGI
jgi:hypothetical protein